MDDVTPPLPRREVSTSSLKSFRTFTSSIVRKPSSSGSYKFRGSSLSNEKPSIATLNAIASPVVEDGKVMAEDAIEAERVNSRQLIQEALLLLSSSKESLSQAIGQIHDANKRSKIDQITWIAQLLLFFSLAWIENEKDALITISILIITTLLCIVRYTKSHKTMAIDELASAKMAMRQLGMKLEEEQKRTGIKEIRRTEEDLKKDEKEVAIPPYGTEGGGQLTADGKISNLKGYRFNFFANIPGLEFERDVLYKLSNSEEIHTFRKFKAKFDAVFDPSTAKHAYQIPDEFTKLRFLQADKFDVDKAMTRLLATVKWRVSSSVDDFMENVDWQLIKRGRALRPRVFVGYDKQGRAVQCERLGEFFGSEEAYSGLSLEEWVRFYSFELGEMTHVYRGGILLGGPYQHRISYLADLSGLRLMNAIKLLPYLKTLIKEVETFYPEFAGSVVLINAPTFMSRVWSLGKKFIDPTTAEKVKIISGPYSDTIIEQFGLDVIPQEYGGTNPMTVPHPPKRITADFNRQFPYTKSDGTKVGSSS